MIVKCIKDFSVKSGGGETFFKEGFYYDANQPCIGLSGSTINMFFIKNKKFAIETIFEELELSNLNENGGYGWYTSPYKMKPIL